MKCSTVCTHNCCKSFFQISVLDDISTGDLFSNFSDGLCGYPAHFMEKRVQEILCLSYEVDE